jgi:hypothetical protein
LNILILVHDDVLSYIIGQEFERDESVQAYVFGLIDDTHTSATELFNDAVVRDCATD